MPLNKCRRVGCCVDSHKHVRVHFPGCSVVSQYSSPLLAQATWAAISGFPCKAKSKQRGNAIRLKEVHSTHTHGKLSAAPTCNQICVDKHMRFFLTDNSTQPFKQLCSHASQQAKHKTRYGFCANTPCNTKDCHYCSHDKECSKRAMAPLLPPPQSKHATQHVLSVAAHSKSKSSDCQCSTT